MIIVTTELSCSKPPSEQRKKPLDSQEGKIHQLKLVEIWRRIGPTERYKLTVPLAEKFISLSIECVGRPYPNKPADVLISDHDVKPPAQVHPSFYGCFDYHSAVHGHWAMVRALKKFPQIRFNQKIRQILSVHLGRESLEKEASYFSRRYAETFERPYGWGWVLRLSAELKEFDDEDARIWEKNLKPLEQRMVEGVYSYLPKLTFPVRAGTHHNTAFSLVHFYDYARASGNNKLLSLITRRARDFYLQDSSCPVEYEPSGEDFISPCLAEADIMRRVLEPEEFIEWFDSFIPLSDDKRWEKISQRPKIIDKKDPLVGHLLGLCFQKAWSMRGVAGLLESKDPRRRILIDAANAHENFAIKEMFDSGYGGTHWLATFALYGLTDVGIEKESEKEKNNK